MEAGVRLRLLLVLALFVPALAYCQWKELPATGSPPNHLADRTTLAGQSGVGPLITATLVDKDRNAQQHQAVVDVQTDGVRIVDPASVNHEPRLDEAHIQYQLDKHPIQNSTSMTYVFRNLASGEHTIHVGLAASDNQQLGKRQTLKVTIP